MPERAAERRAFTFEVRAVQDEAHGDHLVGRPIVYNSPTDIGGMYREIIEAGALDHADLRDVRFLVNHNIDMVPLARSRNNNANSTMQLMPDDRGMEIRVDLDTANNATARTLYSAVQRGDLDGMSFMFYVGAEEWDDLNTDYPTRRIKSISSVLEVSAVTFPAYASTEISARNRQTLDSARAALESARRSAKPDGLALEKLKAHYLYDIEEEHNDEGFSE